MAGDPDTTVRVPAAEALCHSGESGEALPLLVEHRTVSSLETLAETDPDLLAPVVADLHGMADDQSIRSVLITLGELPHVELYRDVYEEGLELNRNRRN